VVYDEELWICGGRSATIDLMDLVNISSTVTQITIRNNIAPRRKHTSTLIGNSIVSFGGFNGEYLADLNFIEIPLSLTKGVTPFHLIMESLYFSGLYSDFVVLHREQSIRLHKFILLAAFRKRSIDSQFR